MGGQWILPDLRLWQLRVCLGGTVLLGAVCSTTLPLSHSCPSSIYSPCISLYAFRLYSLSLSLSLSLLHPGFQVRLSLSYSFPFSFSLLLSFLYNFSCYSSCCWLHSSRSTSLSFSLRVSRTTFSTLISPSYLGLPHPFMLSVSFVCSKFSNSSFSLVFSFPHFIRFYCLSFSFFLLPSTVFITISSLPSSPRLLSFFFVQVPSAGISIVLLKLNTIQAIFF